MADLTFQFTPGKDAVESRNAPGNGVFIYHVWSDIREEKVEIVAGNARRAGEVYLEDICRPEENCTLYVRGNHVTLTFAVSAVPSFRYTMNKIS